MMRLLLAIGLLCSTLTLLTSAQDGKGVTIKVGKLIDGRGGVQQNVIVHVNGDRIASITKGTGAATYDLSKYTLLPGFIDMHVHILWHFGPDGRFVAGREDPAARLQAGVENAKATVMSGF